MLIYIEYTPTSATYRLTLSRETYGTGSFTREAHERGGRLFDLDEDNLSRETLDNLYQKFLCRDKKSLEEVLDLLHEMDVWLWASSPQQP